MEFIDKHPATTQPSTDGDSDRFRAVDWHFARLLQRLGGGDDGLLAAALLASSASGDGDVCLPLAEHADQLLVTAGRTLQTPPLDEWRAGLRANPLVGDPGKRQPLILDHADRLYLGRYWHLENRLGRQLAERAGQRLPVDETALKVALDRLFPRTAAGPDWQRVAAAVAAGQRLTVITGGPGTGKTTTVTRILALLQGQQTADAPLRLAAIAPTGKAAARLGEAIKEAKAALDCEAWVRDAIPDEAQTIHRLLGRLPGRVGFRHHADNPLHLDLLVVDEASMVDLPLMSRLLDALPPEARLILLGDRDQLASVEAGGVLADICGDRAAPACSPPQQRYLKAIAGPFDIVADPALPPIADSLVTLRHSYRFTEAGGIGRLAAAVNRGAAGDAVDLLAGGEWPDLDWRPLGEGETRPDPLVQLALGHYRRYLEQNDAPSALREFNRFRLLCALRRGPTGVTQLNEAIERALDTAGLVDATKRWYRGRPIMVTRNDYTLRLFNGDIGLIWPEGEAGGLRAFFIGADGGERWVLPSRLPEVETVFAMTVHKSQGSEFDEVLHLLPAQANELVSRELLYTAITRARRHLILAGTAAAVQAAVMRQTRRASGLRSLLWEDNSNGN